MKKLLLTGLLLGVAGAQAAPNFDIWNKTAEPLYFAVATGDKMPLPAGLKELKGSGEEAKTIKGRLSAAASFFGKKVTGGKADESDTYSQQNIDTSGKVSILLARKATLAAGDTAVLITINANGKDVIVRLKPDNAGNVKFAGDSNKYLFGTQTGVGKGFKIPEAISQKLGGKVPAGRISERGLSLEKNITDADITVNSDFKI